MNRHVVQFSCGAASAVAAKITLARHSNVVIYNAFIQEEHADNRRFLADCERWFRHPITVLRDEKYGASTHEVWRQRRFIASVNAPCSKALKRDVLSPVVMPLFGDITVIGYTSEERDRADNLRELYPMEQFYFPLIEDGLSKEDCLSMVQRAGIELPLMYRLGYDNANCIGCPKGGEKYWRNIRDDFPAQFVQIRDIQRDLGPGASFLRFRSGPRKNERMSLDELPAGRGTELPDDPSFSCSFLCERVEQEIAS